MDPVGSAVLRSWSLDPWTVLPLLLAGLVYLRGWLALRRRDPAHFDGWRLTSFLTGLALLFLALASPLDAFGSLLLQAHMGQHLLLMMVVPLLLLLGAPELPLLRGLPAPVRRAWVALLRQGWLAGLGRRLTTPWVAWLLFVGATWLWHVPYFYELALASPGWHHVEHACFLGTGLLFWWPVFPPYPSRPRGSRWIVLPYLFFADVQNTVLSALLTFSDRVLYPHYVAVPRLGGLSALDDQAAAGVLMWVPGSLLYLVPLAWIGAHLLYGGAEQRPGKPSPATRVSLPLVAPRPAAAAASRFDLLRVPVVGRFLRWRHARPALQVPLLLLAGAVVLDGFLGPQVAPMNLAGVLPWVHWRGLVVLALLVAGNLFCMACPFLLPRTLARRWLSARHRWPRPLRSKWLAVGLLVLFFGAYEAFALWASPWWTAWIVVGYFVAAFAIDGLFQGAAFCKYVCPIGQFHFVQSLTSPLEVQARDPVVCLDCRTKDCIRGGQGVAGCELHLFLPRKAGNLDCTFCLDCAHACPHDNVGIVAVAPGAALLEDRQRSGIGRFSRRTDLAALVLVLVFAAFANAAGMTEPVLAAEDRLAAALGLASRLPVATAGILGSLVLVPFLLVAAAAWLGRRWGGAGRLTEQAALLAFALVPLGAGMWLAHYSFHLFTSAGGLLPVLQRVAADLGWHGLGVPAFPRACCVGVASWVLPAQIVFLDLGLLLSLYTAYRVARAWPRFLPWAVVIVLLFGVGLWIVFQPMQMRGTLLAGG